VSSTVVVPAVITPGQYENLSVLYV
jgi:hypothetical protein